MPTDETMRALSGAEVTRFIRDGFVRLDRAFPRDLADQGRAVLWRATKCDPDDPKTWTQPVIRLGYYGEEPFKRAANTPVLYAAFDQLVGKGRWLPRPNLGTFPVRFPHPHDPGDAGWHVDLSFPGATDEPNEQRDFSSWRVNVTSRGRALLMLFLFSDVGERDAPTRIRVGSHLDMARYLQPAGEAGMSHLVLDRIGIDRPQALATGEAGTVYLSICVIPFWCTRRSRTGGPVRASWRSLRCIQASRYASIGKTATTLWSRSRSGRRCSKLDIAA
jgi:hypothetical protein